MIFVFWHVLKYIYIEGKNQMIMQIELMLVSNWYRFNDLSRAVKYHSLDNYSLAADRPGLRKSEEVGRRKDEQDNKFKPPP